MASMVAINLRRQIRIRYKRIIFALSLFCFLFLLQIVFAQNTQDIKADIYSKLKCCVCKVPFNKCVCSEAKEIKGYVEALLETRVTKDEIFYRVAKKFSVNAIADKEIKAEIEKRLIDEMGEKRPQIILEPTSFNFGQVSKKQRKITKIFKLYNKGTEDLTITNIRVSCNCVAASLRVGKNRSPSFGVGGATPGWRSVIEPGKSGGLEVELDLAHPSMAVGKEIRDIFISSNDPLYPETKIRIEAQIED